MKNALILALFLFAGSAKAALITYSESQTFTGNLNFPTVVNFTFATPTFAPVSDVTLLTRSLGDWSWEGTSSTSNESASVSIDGNLLISDLFRFNANLDPGSPTKNDNASAIFQTITIPQALFASLVTDGNITLSYTLQSAVNISSSASFLTAELSYRYNDSTDVPAPASLGLIGLAFLALRTFRARYHR